MKDVWRQTLILVAVMSFLVITTVFMLETEPADSEPITEEGNETEIDPDEAGLIDQSIAGWRMLYDDIQTGWSAVMNLTQEEEDEENG